MVGRRPKIKIKQWLKRPKAVPKKTKFGPKYKFINYSKSHIWNSFFGNIISDINLTHFTNLNSLDTENNMLPQHSQKPF